MRTHMIQQYKKIKNSPMRSPSPDYSCRNKSKKSCTPLEQSHLIFNTIHNIRTVQFPTIPVQIMNKKRSSQTQNIRPATKQQLGTTAISKNQKNGQKYVPHISNFMQSPENVQEDEGYQFQTAYQLVCEIHSCLFPNYLDFMNKSQQSTNKIKSMIGKLTSIQSQVKYLIKQSKNIQNQNQVKTQQNNKNIDLNNQFHLHQPNNQSFISSPIKNKQHHDEDSLSIAHLNQLLHENTKLKKQLKSLRLQIGGSNQKKRSNIRQIQVDDWQANTNSNYKSKVEDVKKQDGGKQVVIWEGVENDSSFSSTTYQFLKQKITFLEHELENQLEKMAKIQALKNQQIALLQKRIAQIIESHRLQFERYKKIIEQSSKKIPVFEDSRVDSSKPPLPKRSRINSETTKIQGDIQKFSQPPRKIQQKRKALSWDKEEVISICDNQLHNQMSQYSEAERVDIDNMFSTRKETSQKKQRQKAHYEQIIANNTIKYHQELQILQQQLLQLKTYLQQHDEQSDLQHKNCPYRNVNNLGQNGMYNLDQNMYISELEKELKILKNEVQEQKKQNGKLRDIISRTIEDGNKKVQRKNKGRKLQKIAQKSVKSDDISQREHSSMMDSNINFSLQNIPHQDKDIPQANQ